MTIEQYAEESVRLKQNMNCCQAVLCALADQTGFRQEQLLALGSGFGVGMGNMEATCGALVGAVMVAGLKLQTGTIRYSRQLSERFRADCGATVCKELKGRDTGKVLCACDDCVKNAVLAYGDLVGLD